MKKLILLILVFILYSLSNISAQKSVYIGFLGGLNLSKITGEDAKNNSIRLAYSLGGFATLSLSNSSAIRTEIHFSSKGFYSEEKNTGVDGPIEYSITYEGSISLDYLEIPIFAVYSINNNFNIFGGPYMDIFLSGEANMEAKGYQKFDNGSETITKNIRESETEELKSKDMSNPGFGLTIGAEYLRNQFSFGARYSLGLSQIPKKGDANIKHSNIQLMVGFYLP